MPKINKTTAKALNIPDKSLQTILFNREHWNLMSARQWLKNHGYQFKEYRYTKNQIRFWQTPDIINASFYAKQLPNNIILIFQEY